MLNLEHMVVSKVENTIVWTEPDGKTYRQEPINDDAVELIRDGERAAVLTFEHGDFVVHEPDYLP